MPGDGMSDLVVSLVVSRLDRARAEMRSNAVDALVVTHLPNIRYLTGFAGTAGLVVLTAETCSLIVDFRYQTVARSLVAADPELSRHVTVVVPARSYDETLAEVLRESGTRRIGIEAASMPVSRFNRLVGGTGCRGTDAAPKSGCAARSCSDRADDRSAAGDQGRDQIATLREAGRRIVAGGGRGGRSLPPAGRSESDIAAEIDAVLRRRRIRASGVRDDRGVGPEQRAPARAAGPSDD